MGRRQLLIQVVLTAWGQGFALRRQLLRGDFGNDLGKVLSTTGQHNPHRFG